LYLALPGFPAASERSLEVALFAMPDSAEQGVVCPASGKIWNSGDTKSILLETDARACVKCILMLG
jgi:hypothetical protein